LLRTASAFKIDRMRLNPKRITASLIDVQCGVSKKPN
jgi:hypothetical protein